jgi:hypothetical protein
MRPACLFFVLLSIVPSRAGGPAAGPRAGGWPQVPPPPRIVPAEVAELPELASQARVYTAVCKARNDQVWVDRCLDLDLDLERFGCRIVAYRLRWFSGKWSGWFVPGVNDLYKKPGEPLRRYWACFNDHEFEIIYRTHDKPIDFPDRAQ